MLGLAEPMGLSSCNRYFVPPGSEIYDREEADITAAIIPAVEHIEAVLNSRPDAVVFVHCVQGISRSTSVVVAYLMRANRALDFTAALRMVQAVRPRANPNASFVSQVQALQPLLQPDSEAMAVPQLPPDWEENWL